MQNKNYKKLISIAKNSISAYGSTCYNIKKKKDAFASRSQP